MIALVTMPWDAPHVPSMPLGILHALLARAGMPVRTFHFNLAWLAYAAEHGERMTVAEATEVAEAFCGLGDWVFDAPSYRAPDPARDAAYLDHVRSLGRPEPVIARATRLRALVPGFLERCVDELAGASVVGLTSSFSQNVPSIVLARLLKERSPGVRVVLGGANCDGPMGAALARSFPCFDVVVRGESEGLVLPLFRELLDGAPVTSRPGLCVRRGDDLEVVPQGGEPPNMNDIPTPDFDDYFARLATLPVAADIQALVSVPFETARGCWWGEKQHCTFCGLNGAGMAFRSKDPERAWEDIVGLSGRYRRLDLMAVDNILDYRYFGTLLPRLAVLGADLRFFYEVKANLRRDQLEVMRAAGLRRIQPGIESLSTPILTLMRKGVTALHNVRLLKWCAELGIQVDWNLLYGFPGEPVDEYARMADLVPSLAHLAPPQLCRLQLERWSPYHARPADFGLRVTGPKPYYRYLYDVDADALSDLAYCFDYDYVEPRDAVADVATLRDALHRWQDEFARTAGGLTWRRGPGFLRIADRRADTRDIVLDELEARIYLACDAGATPAAVVRALEEPDLGADEVRALCDDLVGERLMMREGDRYLALALAAERRTGVQAA